MHSLQHTDLTHNKVWNNNFTLIPGQETPSEQDLDLQAGSKGRQRKKNSKYLNYETDDLFDVEQKTPKQSSGGGAGASPKKTPARSGKPENVIQETADKDKDETDNAAQESGEKAPEKTPKRRGRGRGRKTSSKRTPAKKTPATGGCLPAAAGEAVDAVEQENGTPKPKRKYVKRKQAQNATPVTEPLGGEAPVMPEEETEPGGRRRRSAAIM